MSEADDAIADLDSALADYGQDIVLRRVVGLGANVANLDVKCRASVRTWRLKEEQIVAGVEQAVVIVVISPTQIANAQWPGGSTPGQSIDPSIPRRNDKLVIAGRLQNIDAVETIRMGSQAVRFEMSVAG
jgi:hypothetical protein